MGCVASLTYSEGDGSLTGAGGMPRTGSGRGGFPALCRSVIERLPGSRCTRGGRSARTSCARRTCGPRSARGEARARRPAGCCCCCCCCCLASVCLLHSRERGRNFVSSGWDPGSRYLVRPSVARRRGRKSTTHTRCVVASFNFDAGNLTTHTRCAVKINNKKKILIL